MAEEKSSTFISAASSVVTSTPNIILRGLKNPARFYRVNQLSAPTPFRPIRSRSSHRRKNGGDENSVGASGILAFINGKSGGRLGEDVLKRLSTILGKGNVYDLCDKQNDPVKILKSRNYENSGYRIIAGGGDGTSAWIFDSLDKAELLDKNAVAVLPLGTGNDMAGFLKWGYAFEKHYDLAYIVELVSRGEIVKIDRWQISVSNQVPKEDAQSHLPYEVFNNYLSVGTDASVALKFHTERNEDFKEDSRRTRIQNIFQYFGKYVDSVIYGARTGISLADLIDLECDDMNLNARLHYIKPDTLLFLNIKSYAGGCRPWGTANEISAVPYDLKWKRQKADDGFLEVIAYTALEFSDVALGGRGHRISQCQKVRFTTKSSIPMKVDGEPVMMQPCTIEISLRNQAFAIKRVTSKNARMSRISKVFGQTENGESDIETDPEYH